MIRLLQEKDNKLKQAGSFGSKHRQNSVERFIQRFSRDLDDEEEVGERNVVLRRLVLRKIKDFQDVFIAWRREVQIQRISENIESE